MKYKKISSIDQYNDYCEIHENLTYKNHEKHKDEIDLIEVLIDEYDSRESEHREELNPVEFLKYILEEEELSKTELAKQIDVSKQLISDIVLYRRVISLDMVNKLAERFKMQPKAFSRPYQLKPRKNTKEKSAV